MSCAAATNGQTRVSSGVRRDAPSERAAKRIENDFIPTRGQRTRRAAGEKRESGRTRVLPPWCELKRDAHGPSSARTRHSPVAILADSQGAGLCAPLRRCVSPSGRARWLSRISHGVGRAGFSAGRSDGCGDDRSGDRARPRVEHSSEQSVESRQQLASDRHRGAMAETQELTLTRYHRKRVLGLQCRPAAGCCQLYPSHHG